LIVTVAVAVLKLAIRQISEVINQINDISNTIASAVEEQTATANELQRLVSRFKY
jgi:methyl-accepting chemotaxis protein